MGVVFLEIHMMCSHILAQVMLAYTGPLMTGPITITLTLQQKIHAMYSEKAGQYSS